MARRTAKVDANQPDIVENLRANGCFVQSLAAVGDGCPDLLVARNGVWRLIEVKLPGEQLRPSQKDWHRDSAPYGPTHVAYTVDQALLIMGVSKASE